MTRTRLSPMDALAELDARTFAFIAFLVRAGERVTLRGAVILDRDVRGEAAWRGSTFAYLCCATSTES